MFYKKYFLVFLLLACFLGLNAQDSNKVFVNGAFSGVGKYFIKDAKIGAANTPQYEEDHFGADAWFNLNANFSTFNGGLRFDFFHNTNLLDPTSSYTDRGLGMWFLEKKIKKINLRVGSIYDQIGSGIIFKSFEERPLLIDNALKGVKIDYKINENWKWSTFTGKQKYLFSSYDGLLSGTNIDGFFNIGSKEKISFVPGIGIVHKRLSESSVDKLVLVLRNYIGDERINTFSFNSYAISVYNSLNFKSFSWYLETAFKSPEVFFDPNNETTKITGTQSSGRFVKEGGSVLYSTLSYSVKGLGITLEAKRTKNFDFRIDPTLLLNKGLINFLPPMNHITTYRLTSRYNPATQYTSEKAIQMDLNLKLNKKFSININGSNITTLKNDLLYRELFADLLFKPNTKVISHFGVQSQWYNQSKYEGKPETITPMVQTITPFVDVLYKFTRKKSLKIESQYMHTQEDFGSWFYLLTEFGIAPHWRFELSGMYNIFPNPDNPNLPENSGQKILYPTFGALYQYKQTRYGLRYVKQVEGVICTGGICRLEPAFSGVRFEINTNF